MSVYFRKYILLKNAATFLRSRLLMLPFRDSRPVRIVVHHAKYTSYCKQFPLPVEKQCLQVLSGCPWMFSIRWDRCGPLFSLTQLRWAAGFCADQGMPGSHVDGSRRGARDQEAQDALHYGGRKLGSGRPKLRSGSAPARASYNCSQLWRIRSQITPRIFSHREA